MSYRDLIDLKAEYTDTTAVSRFDQNLVIGGMKGEGHEEE